MYAESSQSSTEIQSLSQCHANADAAPQQGGFTMYCTGEREFVSSHVQLDMEALSTNRALEMSLMAAVPVAGLDLVIEEAGALA